MNHSALENVQRIQKYKAHATKTSGFKTNIHIIAINFTYLINSVKENVLPTNTYLLEMGQRIYINKITELINIKTTFL